MRVLMRAGAGNSCPSLTVHMRAASDVFKQSCGDRKRCHMHPTVDLGRLETKAKRFRSRVSLVETC